MLHHGIRFDADVPRLLQRAHAEHVEGRLAKAEKLYKAVLERDPDNVDALHLLGILTYQAGRPAEALRYLAAALKRHPRSAPMLASHGMALHALDRLEEALASYDAALLIAPGDADLYNRQGIARLNLGRPEQALESFARALALDPHHLEALGNRGNVLLKLDRLEDAIASYDAMRALGGDSARVLTNRAHALRKLDRPQDALADLQKAVSIAPDFAEAQFELGMVQLTFGQFDAGWVAYEKRWDTGKFGKHRRDFRSPRWTGRQDLRGRTILLHAEQGFGDAIQFVRYAALLPPLGATVLLEVQPELVGLIADAGFAASVFARGDKLSPFDLHCPLMSLPLACRAITTAIPAAVPYLGFSNALAAQWAKRLSSQGLRVGVAWAGNSTHNNDANRSIALARFASLFALADAQFVSLQREMSAEDHALLRRFGNVDDVGDGLRDFADTAALISQLDCIVSVDTAVAHLAGALAKPVLMLLPMAADFRWLRARNDSPWYPTATLFRQPRRGDWDSVIEEVRAHIEALRRKTVRYALK